MRNERSAVTRVTNGHGISLEVDAWGHLVLQTSDGRRHLNVEPVRAFPISEPSSWIAFCDCEGQEILCLDSIESLSPETRRILEEELALREFVPTIHRVVRVSAEATPSDWEVETDRGPTRFTLDNEDDVRRLGPYRVMIMDARKLRFQVPDTRKLDSHSRRILERYL